jgi:hypothetical protein
MVERRNVFARTDKLPIGINILVGVDLYSFDRDPCASFAGLTVSV